VRQSTLHLPQSVETPVQRVAATAHCTHWRMAARLLTRCWHASATYQAPVTDPGYCHGHLPACRRLLPALLYFGEPGGSPEGRGEALKYVRFCMHRLGSEEPAVHNLAVALLSLDASQVGRRARPSA
jgi:hypothetical protein